MILTYTTPSQKRKLQRKLYGYIDYSKNCKYKYKRKGLLDKIDYVKVNKATIMVSEFEAPLVINLFRQLRVKFKTF